MLTYNNGKTLGSTKHDSEEHTYILLMKIQQYERAMYYQELPIKSRKAQSLGQNQIDLDEHSQANSGHSSGAYLDD